MTVIYPKPKRTPEGNRANINRLLSDDDLIDIATTCSDRGISLAAEMHLRNRYPSKRTIKPRAEARSI